MHARNGQPYVAKRVCKYVKCFLYDFIAADTGSSSVGAGCKENAAHKVEASWPALKDQAFVNRDVDLEWGAIN